MKLCVAICTYNREQQLEKALKSLLNQLKPAENVELLVIDNNSTDSTKEITLDMIKGNDRAHYILEKKQGTSHARNRAFEVSDADYFGYIDDDAIAPIGFINRALRIIYDYEPKLFGGPIYPYYTEPKPHWFKDEYEIRIHHKNSGWFSSGNLSGSNLFIKRDLFNAIGGFNIEFGIDGKVMIFGEDTDFVHRTLSSGVPIYYDLELVIKHWVPKYKMNLLYFLLANYKMGKSYQNINKSVDISSQAKVAELLDMFFDDLNEIIKSDEGQIENRFVEDIAFEFNLIGQQISCLQRIDYKNDGLTVADIIKVKSHKKEAISLRSYLVSIYKLTKLLFKRFSR